MPSFEKLISGYRIFKTTTYEQRKDIVSHYLALGIKPSTLVITSCSLQVSPDILTSSNPGELYVIRNVGGLVPPYGEGGANGTIAAIEYAIKELEVANVIVLGHSHCDGVHLLMDQEKEEVLQNESNPIASWLHIMDEAKDAVKAQLKKKSEEEQEAACEQEVILVSLKNLISYPFVEKRIEGDELAIYGWHFDIESGTLRTFNPETRLFEPIG